jgi:hypothetical protein
MRTREAASSRLANREPSRADIEPVLPVANSLTLAHEVIDYTVSFGTVRTVAEGRLVVK